MSKRPPMTAETARHVVQQMREKTQRKPQVQLLKYALGPLGNLSEEAKEVYRARLRELGESVK